MSSLCPWSPAVSKNIWRCGIRQRVSLLHHAHNNSKCRSCCWRFRNWKLPNPTFLRLSKCWKIAATLRKCMSLNGKKGLLKKPGGPVQSKTRTLMSFWVVGQPLKNRVGKKRPMYKQCKAFLFPLRNCGITSKAIIINLLWIGMDGYAATM